MQVQKMAKNNTWKYKLINSNISGHIMGAPSQHKTHQISILHTQHFDLKAWRSASNKLSALKILKYMYMQK